MDADGWMERVISSGNTSFLLRRKAWFGGVGCWGKMPAERGSFKKAGAWSKGKGKEQVRRTRKAQLW